jgi:hypothetical protein
MVTSMGVQEPAAFAYANRTSNWVIKGANFGTDPASVSILSNAGMQWNITSVNSGQILAQAQNTGFSGEDVVSENYGWTCMHSMTRA